MNFSEIKEKNLKFKFLKNEKSFEIEKNFEQNFEIIEIKLKGKIFFFIFEKKEFSKVRE